jgi:phytoene dehydrogenase-like protein
MAGIWGDGQRGGIFGARVDPRLLAANAALENQAGADREAQVLAQMQAAQPGFEDRITVWWGSLPPSERQRYIQTLNGGARE